jgi:hypothetical protein
MKLLILIAATLAFTTSAALGADALTMADLAPKDSLFVVGVDDSKAMWESFDRTGFRAIWDDPTFKKWFEKHSKEAMDDFAADLDSLGLKMEDLKRPTGPMGLAGWFTGGERAVEGESQPPAILIMANYGEDAQEMDEKIVEALEKADQQETVDLSDKDHDGVTVYTFRFPEEKAPDADAEDEDLDMMNESSGPPYPEMHYARVEGSLVVSSEITGIENAIDRLKGDDKPSIGDEAEFNEARRRLGEAQGYAVVMMKPLLNMLKETAENSPDAAFEQYFAKMTGVLGFNELRAGAMGLRFDTDDAMMEQSYAVLAAKKAGLVALFDAPAMAFDPPAFVGADAATITMMQFNFNGVIPLANQVVASLPEEEQAMVGQQIQMATMMIGPVLANLGPEVCIVGSLKRPIDMDSQQQVWAIKMRDAKALEQAIAGAMPMVGFESRDFQGNRIWSPPEGGMVPPGSVAIGMGFGWMFVGPVTGVEDLMRLAGAAENPKLAAEKSFKAATKSLDNRGLAYGFYRVGPSLDWYEWYSRNIDKVMAAQAEEMFGKEPPADEEERQWREEAKKGMMESVPAWLRDLPPMDVIRKHLGDSVLEFRSTADGFDGRTLTLKAGE